MILRVLFPALVSVLLTCVLSAETRKPNIILIISDDHTYSHYGFM